MLSKSLEEVLKNEKIPEVIQRILTLYRALERIYLDHIEFFLEENCISLDIHLQCLCISIMNDIKYTQKLSSEGLRNIFNIVEEYLYEAKISHDTSLLNTYEVIFFEGILNILSNVEDEEDKKKYAKLLHSVIGPIGLELCKHNDEFWGKHLLPYLMKNSN